jgi:hypothetical protein
MLEIMVMVWDMYTNVAELNWLIGPQPFHLLITASPTAIQIKKATLHRFVSTQKEHNILLQKRKKT